MTAQLIPTRAKEFDDISIDLIAAVDNKLFDAVIAIAIYTEMIEMRNQIRFQ
jgi:hypothetical protein